jgi:hypothetical protein
MDHVVGVLLRLLSFRRKLRLVLSVPLPPSPLVLVSSWRGAYVWGLVRGDVQAGRRCSESGEHAAGGYGEGAAAAPRGGAAHDLALW